MFQALTIASRSFQATLRLFFRPAPWGPFLLVLLVQAVLFGLVLGFHHPLVSGLGSAYVELVGGEAATRYPTLYLLLPVIVTRTNLVVAVLLGAIATGAATLSFAHAFGVASSSASVWRRAWRRAPMLIAAAAVVTAVLLGIGALLDRVPAEVVASRAGLRWGMRGLNVLVFVLVQSLFVYTTAWIVLRGHAVWPAIRDSVRVTLRTFVPTVIVIGIPSLMLFPFWYLNGRTDLIIDKFKPEVVSLLVGGQMLAETLALFVVVGATTRLFLWRMEAGR